MKNEKIMEKYTEEEKKLMNEVYEENYDYIDELLEVAKKKGKDYISYLFNEDYFLWLCKEYKNTKDKGEDPAGIELGFIMAFDVWLW
jgi:uncharacterized protein YqiB (DUF1249 family)